MGHYFPDSPPTVTPDTMSSIYPGRPIRPLPKRRLRERLSPDVADSIEYPPTPKSTTPLFYYPYSLRDEGTTGGVLQSSVYPAESERLNEVERKFISRQKGEEAESDDDELAFRNRVYSRQTPNNSGRSMRYVQSTNPTHYPKAQGPASTTSSVDGYDSFENTNNKKKRKIPTTGDISLNGGGLSNDLASLGISGNADDSTVREEAAITDSLYYTSAGSLFNTQGLSGPGRGRYGRARSGRSPLRTLSDTSNNWSNSRNPKTKQAPWPAADESTGIISTAIANAEKTPVTPSRGQENISLLQHEASKKASPSSTQFTFTFDSQVPRTVNWPNPGQHGSKMQANMNNSRAVGTHSAQTDGGNDANPLSQSRGSVAPQHTSTNAKQGSMQSPPVKKNRRRPGRVYLVAARARREQQEYQNYHHPPSPENAWICEFCEYERIFGTPPEALIRQYEIKDRRIRKQDAERRRLLEKAKMKGRKGKKGSKAAAARNQSAANERQAPMTANQQAASTSQSQSQGTQSEEYYEDEYEDDYVQEDHTSRPPKIPSVPAKMAHGVDTKAHPTYRATPVSNDLVAGV